MWKKHRYKILAIVCIGILLYTCDSYGTIVQQEFAKLAASGALKNSTPLQAAQNYASIFVSAIGWNAALTMVAVNGLVLLLSHSFHEVEHIWFRWAIFVSVVGFAVAGVLALLLVDHYSGCLPTERKLSLTMPIVQAKAASALISLVALRVLYDLLRVLVPNPKPILPAKK